MGIQIRVHPMQIFISLILVAVADQVSSEGTIAPAATSAAGKSMCYNCQSLNSVDKSQTCFTNPTSTKTCSTGNGCYISRREETDEYGDVTKYTIYRGCVDNIIAGTGCYSGTTEGDLGADKKGEQCRYECDGNLCNSAFGAAVSILL